MRLRGKDFKSSVNDNVVEEMRNEEQPIRILQYVRVLDNGGIEKFIFSYLENMDREKVNFDFLLTRNQKESYDDELKKYGCQKKIVELKLCKIPIIRCIESYVKLKRFFRENTYKVIHFQSVGETIGGAFAILAAKHAGIPVRIVHGHSATYDGEVFYKKILQELGRKAHMKWGTHWFACSKEAALLSFGEDACNQGKVCYIHNAICSSNFRYVEDVRKSVRKELNLQGKFVIGNIGRMSPPKNHVFMVNILEKILEKRSNAVLVFVGGYSTSYEGYLDGVKEYVHKKRLDNSVIFTGERKDINRLLNAMDVFLFPSLWEGLGIAAIEAQANGLPVVASTKVPKETKFTNLIQYIDLKAPIDVWSEAVLKNYELSNRQSHEAEIRNSGYDIETEACRLQYIYQKLSLDKFAEI